MENNRGARGVPPVVSLAEFLATMRTWLDHHCIVLADDLKRVTITGKEGVYDAEFDNPRDARLFERRFANEPTPHTRLPADLKALLRRKTSARTVARPVGAWVAAEAPSK